MASYSLFIVLQVWTYNLLMLVVLPLLVTLGAVQIVVATAFWRAEKRRKGVMSGGLFLVAAAIVPLLLTAMWRGLIAPSMEAETVARSEVRLEEVSKQYSKVRVGDQVMQIEKLLADASVPLNRPKVLVVNFFATWCSPCIAELPHFQRLADKYSDNPDVAFVVIGREESQETLDAFVAKHGWRIPFLADPEKTLYSEFADGIIPRTYLLDKDRKIRFEIVGFREKMIAELDTMIEEVAHQK